MRRVLIISTTFFPDPQVSAIRMTQWCRHLPEQGWKPYVLCRYYGYEATAEELATAVHPTVTLEYLDKQKRTENKGNGRSPRWLQRILAPLRERPGLATLAVPDVSIFFWR